uniref:Fibronectin type-III domain-containing protein n=1 Tax=Gouania willdenowi TaxID=441366 RepID=A0A8C5GA05_GOUWI
MAHLAGSDGHSLSCYTSSMSCSVDGLHCGVIYHTSVIAIGNTMNSSSSTTVMLASAPCPSENVTATLDCYNNTATVSWSSATGANTHTVTAESADGYLDSCQSEVGQCELTGLKCGQTYNITLTSTDDQCQAQTLSDVTLRTRPCKPLGVGVDLQCGTNVANMYWNEQEGVDFYVATTSCSVGTTQCNSTTSTCQLPILQCGETCQFSVTASSSLCFSEDSSVVELQTDPCQPTDVIVNNRTCNNDTARLEWSEAKGALLYTLEVTGDLGFTRSLQTNSTTLEVDLPCGQVFNFTVVAQDERCESAGSLAEQYKSGPCIPEYLQIFTSCEDSMGGVSWVMSSEAETYLAVAVGEDGHTHECTSNSTSCIWDDLHCGDVYTVYVIANDYLCTSLPSNSTTLSMAPCIPQNLTTSFNCSTKVGSLSWNVSETAEFYIVTAQNNDGHTVQLSTNDSWTFISEFQCGQQYYLSVQAADSMCTSTPSQSLVLLSEPCAPTNITSYMDCISNIAVVSWTGSAGAEFYTAAVTTEDGQSNSCWSDSEQCGMPNVQCGQEYSVTVIASNTMCDSDLSVAETLKSVPCVPSNVDVAINCSTNQAVVSWSASDGALSYKLTAKSAQGDVSACETSDLGCTLTSLTCGRSYSVQVVAVHDFCSSLPSQPVNFNSGKIAIH